MAESDPGPVDASSSAAGVQTGPAEPGDSDQRSRRGLVIAGVVVAVVLVVGGIGVFAVSKQSKAGYDAGTESRFLDACTASGGDPVRDTCQCLYDEIVATIPFEEFHQVDRDLRDQQVSSGTVQLPADLDALRADCVAKSTQTS